MENPDNLSITISIVSASVAIVVAIISLFLWNRAEARTDVRHYDNENKQLRRDLIEAVRAIEAESRDFHGRLCAIEERKGKK